MTNIRQGVVVEDTEQKIRLTALALAVESVQKNTTYSAREIVHRADIFEAYITDGSTA